MVGGGGFAILNRVIRASTERMPFEKYLKGVRVSNADISVYSKSVPGMFGGY